MTASVTLAGQGPEHTKIPELLPVTFSWGQALYRAGNLLTANKRASLKRGPRF